MFVFCCDPPQETRREPLAEIDHLNPINRRINSRKTSKVQDHKSDRSQLSVHAATLTISQHAAKKPLSKSILLPEGNDHHLKATKLSDKTSYSANKDTLEVKKNPISSVHPLKKSNKKLDKSLTILNKSTRSIEGPEIKHERKQNKIKDELLELKERLRKVDLTKICKGL